MSNPTNKTYELKLMTDMYEIPADRFDDFIIQLKKWHKETSGLAELIKIVNEIAGEKMPEEYGTLKWTDDGIDEGHTTVNVVQIPATPEGEKK